MRKLTALIGLLGVSTAAQAGYYVSVHKTPNSVPLWTQKTISFYDGNKLYESCTSGGAVQKAFCNGYIAGVADVLQNQYANNVCLPSNAIVEQIVDTVKKDI